MVKPMEHFQLRMNNATGSDAFYEHVFGWSINTLGDGYFKVLDETCTPPLIGQLNHVSPWTDVAVIPFFNVSDIQDVVDKVEDTGGEVAYFKFRCPILNCNYAIIRDIEDCLFGVYTKS